MIFEASLCSLSAATILAAGWGMLRYRTPLNPLTTFAAFDMGILTILSGVVAYTGWPMDVYTESDLATVAFISLAYLSGATIPFLFSGSLPSQVFGWVMLTLSLVSERIAARFNRTKYGILLFCSVCAFAALASVGGGGLLWLTDPRLAYQTYRAGAGIFFVMTQWFLVSALIYYLWSRRPRKFKLVQVVIFFMGAAFFTGSKGMILTILIVVLFWYHFTIRKLSTGLLISVPTALFSLFLGLQFVQGTAFSLVDSVNYFSDYFRVTTMFVARIDECGYRFGAGALSSFWFYVPRALYADKPYEYGDLLIQQFLWPGTAAAGATPGILPWSLAFLDFGIAGVFVSGLANGMMRRAAYEHYLKERGSFFAFLFMVHLSLWPVLVYAPALLLVIWSIALNVFLRLRLSPSERFNSPSATITQVSN